ncbi:uncharacterized protein LOC136081846 isoform X1 [Hydra vulgaris]|uniref:Uncharacterized protein LOC136081846 isoform X1 n=1 Tax=Hydra vulgaris TaxID=6087 RepID=A0ABM4C3Q5_HYDVU
MATTRRTIKRSYRHIDEYNETDNKSDDKCKILDEEVDQLISESLFIASIALHAVQSGISNSPIKGVIKLFQIAFFIENIPTLWKSITSFIQKNLYDYSSMFDLPIPTEPNSTDEFMVFNLHMQLDLILSVYKPMIIQNRQELVSTGDVISLAPTLTSDILNLHLLISADGANPYFKKEIIISAIAGNSTRLAKQC